jgi:hypothetical protein
LYGFDGSPLPPMYLAFDSPAMAPTTQLHLNSRIKRLLRRGIYLRDREFGIRQLETLETPTLLGIGCVLMGLVLLLSTGTLKSQLSGALLKCVE